MRFIAPFMRVLESGDYNRSIPFAPRSRAPQASSFDLFHVSLTEVMHARRVGRGIRIVGHQQYRLVILLIQSLEQREYLGRGLGIQVPRGLIREDQIRVGHDRPGDGNALLLAAGELPRNMVHSVFQAHQRQCGDGVLAPLAR